MERKLTAKQRLFCDEYIKSGNAKDAAIKAGYSPRTAKSIGQENLTKPDLKSYIDAKMAEIESHKIADAKEVLEFYTRVLRDEETEEVPIATPKGVTIVSEKPSIQNKIAVSKELLKRYLLSPFEKAKLKKLNAEAGIVETQYKALSENTNSQSRTIIVDDVKETDINANSETESRD
ncbi:terminase small subunit [Lactobacillus gasseri CECT 5714]|uniref:terminase small subunit n=1 Tax=Lactobacillus gasseri TaxID=1596 RepID=UPI0002770043|nr:terminase small subunit [Lactobacillus gasseri]EJN54688.1 Phage terminase, small subunit [Lactobacillus gasseri CECT 5714]MBV6739536.1 terminase small subunit [Lactobacillus gasseri CECT 5714]